MQFKPSQRSTVAAVEGRKAREAQDKARELQDKVDEATLEQIRHRFESDMKTLKDRQPTQEQAAAEAMLDSKYLAQRQACFARHSSNGLFLSFEPSCRQLVCLSEALRELWHKYEHPS